MKKRIMIVGAQSSGKSSIANWLNGTNEPLKKRQDAIYGSCTIDVPAQYLENVSMYRYILTLAQTAGCVLFLVHSQAQESLYPPNFAASFNCPVVGLVVGRQEHGMMSKALSFLEKAGVEETVVLDNLSPEDFAAFRKMLLKYLK